MDKMTEESAGDSSSSDSETPGTTPQISVIYRQQGTMIFSGPGASSGIVNNQRNVSNFISHRSRNDEGSSFSERSLPEDLDTVRESTGDTTSSEAPGTPQQSVIYAQSGTMIFSGPGASSGIVTNQRNVSNFISHRSSNDEGSSFSERSLPEDLDTVRESTGDTTTSEAPEPPQQRVIYAQTGTMIYTGIGASSGIVHNQQNIAVCDTGMISTGDTINAEVAGTSRQSTINNFHGPVNVHGADIASIGGIADQRK